MWDSLSPAYEERTIFFLNLWREAGAVVTDVLNSMRSLAPRVLAVIPVRNRRPQPSLLALKNRWNKVD